MTTTATTRPLRDLWDIAMGRMSGTLTDQEIEVILLTQMLVSGPVDPASYPRDVEIFIPQGDGTARAAMVTVTSRTGVEERLRAQGIVYQLQIGVWNDHHHHRPSPLSHQEPQAGISVHHSPL